MQDELGIGDLPHLGNIVVLEHVFSFPESPCNSDLISYADLHGRGNEHVPSPLGRGLELPDLVAPLERYGLTIRLPDGPLLAGPKPSCSARMEPDHSAGRIV
jgi:hypothetical protein